MKKSKFTITSKDKLVLELVKTTDKKILAMWAIDCTNRILPYFEETHPYDNRPREAINTLKTWKKTGIFNMSKIRKASLDSHAAARETNEDNPARSAARAAGQAVATAHVKTHSLAAANYSLQAVHRAAKTEYVNKLVEKEQKWQRKHLINLIKKYANKTKK